MAYVKLAPEEVELRRNGLASFDGWNERAFCALFSLVCAWRGVPRSYLDLGSGTGAMVNMARKMGIWAWGVDVINGPEHWFVHHSLTSPLELVRNGADDHQIYNRGSIDVGDQERIGEVVTFDVVTCIEVAEHIVPEAASVLCDTIARHLRVGGLLIFTSAPPGQRGHHHVNCQPATYWRTCLYDRGVSYRADYTRDLSHLWGWVSGPLNWLGDNVQVFDK